MKSENQSYWRSLSHLHQTDEYKNFARDEFPEPIEKTRHPLSRRDFLSLMGASMALAGLASCRRPVEKIIPYVIQPENIVPGIANRYATAMPFLTGAYPILVETHEGRPTKIEGHPKHPATLGGSHVFMQAAILGLYDPDRSKFVLHKNEKKTWNDFVKTWEGWQKTIKEQNGRGLAVLSEPFLSPTLFRLKQSFIKEYPEAVWATFDPVSDENIIKGLEIAFGGASAETGPEKIQTGARSVYFPKYEWNKAHVILSLDADFLYSETHSIEAARGFAERRHLHSEKHSICRLYAAESTVTLTGAMADHRMRLRSGQIVSFLGALIKELQSQGLAINLNAESSSDFDAGWIKGLAKDLLRVKGKSIVIAGRQQPAHVHAMVAALNDALGNAGQTVHYYELKDASVSNLESMKRLTGDIQNDRIHTLIVLGGNPAYNAPSDLKFHELLNKIKHTVHLGGYADETAALAEWHIPCSHFMEQWGDVRMADGTASVIQPLIEPLYETKSNAEFLHLLVTGKESRGYDIVRDTWNERIGGIGFEKTWRQVLHEGFLENSAGQPSEVKVSLTSVSDYLKTVTLSAETADIKNMEIVFRPSATVFDGRFANNGWLQELPDPVTKITWDNAALISYKTAQALGLGNNLKDGKSRPPLVRLQYKGRELVMPVWVLPGQADFSVTVALGYGRRAAGRVGNGVGFDAYSLRTSAALYYDNGLTITPTNENYLIANVQDHGGLDEETLVKKTIDKRVPVFIREATVSEYLRNPDFAKEANVQPNILPLLGKDGKPLSAYHSPLDVTKGYQWGVAIDLNRCIGCNACMIACQSENNIPVVGKEHVANGREMHWLRLDRYFSGSVEDPQIVFQPVACHHCENAPCEQVCPVAATVHDREGLNVMVYNRCVGTRYCSNNCPYKVRRFNFLDYNGGGSGFLQAEVPEILKMSRNPDVSVRMRGVMEKCTYCVQRINEAKFLAKKEGRSVSDGEILPACAQSCPAKAIVFGNINDPNSKIYELKNDNRNYVMLAELNIRPRTSYLAKLRNPNPDLEKKV